MHVAVKMPDLGTVTTDPLVVSYWLAEEGEDVWEGQDLVEVVCQEIAFCVPCPVEGRLIETRVFADEQVQPGQVLAVIETADAPESPWDEAADPNEEQ